MKINDIITEGYYNPADDSSAIAHKSDTRRPRLTFSHLNKLRKMRELRKVETEEHLVLVRQMYSQPMQSDDAFG